LKIQFKSNYPVCEGKSKATTPSVTITVTATPSKRGIKTNRPLKRRIKANLPSKRGIKTLTAKL